MFLSTAQAHPENHRLSIHGLVFSALHGQLARTVRPGLFSSFFLLSSTNRSRRDSGGGINDFATAFQKQGAEALLEELLEDRAKGMLLLSYVWRIHRPNLLFCIPGEWTLKLDATRLENAQHPPTANGYSWMRFEIGSVAFPMGGCCKLATACRNERTFSEDLPRYLYSHYPPDNLSRPHQAAYSWLFALPDRSRPHSCPEFDYSDGQDKARVPIRHSGDELDELGGLFNTTLGRIESLIQSMRAALDNVAMTSALSHDRGCEGSRKWRSAPIRMVETSREALADCLEESDYVLTMLNTHGATRRRKQAP